MRIPHVTDAELVIRATAGDGEAFGHLVERYAPAVRRLTRAVLRDDQDADDAAQEGFLAAWRHFGRYDPARPFGPWLMRIVVNAAHDLRRRSQVRAADPVPDTLPSGMESPDRAAARFMVRSPDNAYLKELQRRVIACFEGAAMQTGCELKFEWGDACDLVSTNRPLAEAFTKNARSLGRVMNTRRPGDTHGSTDMGNVTTIVPGIHPFLSITDGPVPGHSTEFAAAAATPKAQETMCFAAKALAMTAIDALTDPGLVTKAKEAFDGSRH